MDLGLGIWDPYIDFLYMAPPVSSSDLDDGRTVKNKSDQSECLVAGVFLGQSQGEFHGEFHGIKYHHFVDMTR